MALKMAKALDPLRRDFVALLAKGYSVDEILNQKKFSSRTSRTTLFRWRREYMKDRLGSDVVKR